MNPTAPTMNTPLNLCIWCRIPAPSLINPSPHPTIKLPRIKIFKKNFGKPSILLKFWNDAYSTGWGVILFASLWLIAYENRYETLAIVNLYLSLTCISWTTNFQCIIPRMNSQRNSEGLWPDHPLLWGGLFETRSWHFLSSAELHMVIEFDYPFYMQWSALEALGLPNFHLSVLWV